MHLLWLGMAGKDWRSEISCACGSRRILLLPTRQAEVSGQFVAFGELTARLREVKTSVQLDAVDGSHFGSPWYQRHGFGRVCHISGLTYPEPQGTVPQALRPLGRVRFIAWRLEHHFLEKFRRGPRYFWEWWAYLDYGPAPGPTFKKALCHTSVWWGVRQTPSNTSHKDIRRFKFTSSNFEGELQRGPLTYTRPSKQRKKIQGLRQLLLYKNDM